MRQSVVTLLATSLASFKSSIKTIVELLFQQYQLDVVRMRYLHTHSQLIRRRRELTELSLSWTYFKSHICEILDYTLV